MAHFWFLTLFILCGIFFEQSKANCADKFKRCNKIFSEEMSMIKFHSAEKNSLALFSSICSTDGIYTRLVSCVKSLSNQCDLTAKSRELICMTRNIKMSTYRYTWRSNIIHDICHQTQDKLLDFEFFKHEKCMSKVLNTLKWTCDEHFKRVKSTSGLESCKHWHAFRDCSKSQVNFQCGPEAANVSDFLFDVHSNYFSTYRLCDLPGNSNTLCWYDAILEQAQNQNNKSQSLIIGNTALQSQNLSSISVTTEKLITISNISSTKAPEFDVESEEVAVNDDSNESMHQNINAARQHDIRSTLPDEFQQDSKHNNEMARQKVQNLSWFIGFLLFIVLVLL